MSTRLLQTIPVTALAAGAITTLTHALNREDVPLLPDHIERNHPDLVVLGATTTTVTVQNIGGSAVSGQILVQRIYSEDRALGGATPAFPFIPSGGAVSSVPTLQGAPYFPADSATNNLQTRFLRPAGNDSNDGLTPATAWSGTITGLRKALEWYRVAGSNLAQRVDITGCTIAASELLELGGSNLGSLNFGIDFSATGPSNYAALSSFQLVATPALVVGGIAITSVVAAPTTGLWTVNVSNVLVPGAHVGQMLLGSGLGQWARIRSNTASAMEITLTGNTGNPTAWTAPIGIYTTGATLTFGDPGDFFNSSAVNLLAMADWFVSGIAFKSTAGSKPFAMQVFANMPLFLQLCDFDGLFLATSPGTIALDACYLNGFTWGFDGASAILRNCLVRNVTCNFHGSSDSGNNNFNECIFDGLVTAFGSGNSESLFAFHVDRSLFSGALAGAISALTGKSRLSNVVISGTTGDAILADVLRLVCDNVQGAGNSGVGCRIQNGAQVQRLNATAVTGAGGDVVLGGSGVVAWAAAPATDVGAAAPQFCRLFT